MKRIVALKMGRLKTGEISACIDVIASGSIVERVAIIGQTVQECVDRAEQVARDHGVSQPILTLGPAGRRGYFVKDKNR